MSAFGYAIAFLLEAEGGYVADLGDGAGPTNRGITARAYPDLDIQALTEADAVALYRRDYWDAIGLEQLPPALGVAMLDAAANHGPRTAVRLLQAALGVPVDGVIGPVTAEAARQPGALERLMVARLVRYTELAQWPRFARAWTRRLLRCLTYCQGVPA